MRKNNGIIKKNSVGRIVISSLILSGGAVGSCYGATKVRQIIEERTENQVLSICAAVGTVLVGMTITNSLSKAVTERFDDTSLIKNIYIPSEPALSDDSLGTDAPEIGDVIIE